MGRYRLSARIATGGMAEVYLGRRIEEDGRRGPSVAVKRLLPHLTSDRRVVQMFLNEARITAQIHHPNVVTILETGMDGGEPFIALELLEGRSFAELRQEAAERGRRVPLGVTLRTLVDACRGLDAAHRAVDEAGRPLRIVHRDFTPDNIHVGANGCVKVIDFGIAKADALGSGTEPGTLKGKFFYMSPEMITGQRVDHRADIFAAGVMLYEQLCGRRPFTGLKPEEVLARITEGRPKPPTAFDPSVPDALEHICLTALHRAPESRFETLQVFIDAIESVGGSAEVASSEAVAAYVESLFPKDSDPKRLTLQRARSADPSDSGVSAPSAASAPSRAPRADSQPPRREPPPRKRRQWALLALAGLALLGLGAGGTYLMLRPTVPPAERLAQAETAPAPPQRLAFLEGIEKDPRATAQELARAGELLMELGAHEAVLSLSETFTQRFPQDLEAHLLEARAATALLMGKRAERSIEEASSLAPKDVRPLLALADLRERQGDVPGALGALAKAYEKRPREARVAPRYGLLLSQSGRLDEAAEVLGAWIREHNDARPLAELAFVRYRQARMEDAAALLKRALRKAPRLAVAHYYLGAVLFQKGDTAGAERAYRQADQLDPEDPRALSARCQLHARTGDANAVAEAKQLIASRFPAQATALAAECSAGH
ncbi:serine/threonine-protein kinase [Stigmatella aurantiaca]|uniref:Serine/threonine protein kinase n=2 Tax=Stigmatella aurantiaca (strain DW4/3-1) TaxID=378806 RepID=E3FUD9_STIAD|nr:serine/threonine-protein kinase [Stigmatella aurantiaca]ADO74637.1 serine/threonine protein kinase [Stigmatella aurantiaca DW4/3-1]